MAAVLCLVLLPLVWAVGFMVGAIAGDLSLTSVLVGIVFVALGAMMFGVSMRLSRDWDADPDEQRA